MQPSGTARAHSVLTECRMEPCLRVRMCPGLYAVSAQAKSEFLRVHPHCLEVNKKGLGMAIRCLVMAQTPRHINTQSLMASKTWTPKCDMFHSSGQVFQFELIFPFAYMGINHPMDYMTACSWFNLLASGVSSCLIAHVRVVWGIVSHVHGFTVTSFWG